VNPIRPSALPPAQPSAAIDPAKLAAQRAFFAAARGDAPAAAAVTAKPAGPSPTSAPAASAASAEAPQRILRPGSLIDIRV
jgi:hypothetical protein